MPIGNDVVDLAEARPTRKEADARFLARVFTDEERFIIERSPDPALALWLLWAAKETLYKMARQRSARAVFAHRDFFVPGLRLPNPLPPRGSLAAGGLLWEWTDDYVHCHREGGEARVALARDGGDGGESAQARRLAQSMVADRYPGARVEREERAPPRFVWRGETLPIELSLSHDGRFVAAALGADRSPK